MKKIYAILAFANKEGSNIKSANQKEKEKEKRKRWQKGKQKGKQKQKGNHTIIKDI